MHYCLNKQELEVLINYILLKINVDCSTLHNHIKCSENWQDELGCLSYLLSEILERNNINGTAPEQIIKLVYGLDEKMFIDIQEFDWKFIEYMVSNVRNSSLTLEDNLIDLQNGLKAFRYDRTIRF